MKALRVYLVRKKDGFEVDYKVITYERYTGFRGKLGFERVTPPDHLEQAFYENFPTLDDIAGDIAERLIGYDEIQIAVANPYLNHLLKRSILRRIPQAKFANPIRRFAMSLENLLRIIPRLDDYFKDINKHYKY